ELKDQPTSSSFSELLTNLKTQREQVTGHQGLTAYENPLGSFVAVISPTGRSDVQLRSTSSNDWKEFESIAGGSSVFDREATSDMNFAQEFVALNALLGSEMEKIVAERSTVVAHLVSLEAVHKSYGASSKQYKAAVSLLSERFGKFAKTEPEYPSTLVFLAP